jgi:hypothetical protein
MDANEHWTLEMEAAIVTAKARDEDWLATFGVDRLFRGGTPGLPWLVKEYLDGAHPAIADLRGIVALLEWRVRALVRLLLTVTACWLYTLVMLLQLGSR